MNTTHVSIMSTFRRNWQSILSGVVIGVLGCTAQAATGLPPVQVIVDMDSQTPGIQSSITVPACTTDVSNIAVYVRDPLQQRSMWSIGYFGGIDRGISFGHAPNNLNQGSVVDLSATSGAPVNPGNTGWILQPYMRGFDGAEVQYAEWGARTAAVISAEPAAPIFTVNIALSGARAGDTFSFHLLDLVRAWAGPEHGAFSTQAAINSLDTGGDITPDGTISAFGIDPDGPVAVPPGAFAVDYIDGPANGGGARIIIVAKPGDVNHDCLVNVDDLLAVINSWGPCPLPCPNSTTCEADIAPTGGNCTVNVDDLLMVINNWG